MNDLRDRALSDFLSGPKRPFTPLYVIGGVVVLVELMLTGAAVLVGGTTQAILLAFAGLVLLLVLVGFFLVLWYRPHHFYGPSEYSQPTSPQEMSESFRHERTVGEPTAYQPSASELQTDGMAANVDRHKEQLSSASDDASEDGGENLWETVFFEEMFSDSIDMERFDEAFRRLQEIEQDDELLFTQELLYLSTKFRHGGDQLFLERLESLAQRPSLPADRAFSAYVHLGVAYRTAGSYRKAETAYQTACDLASDENRRAQAIAGLVESKIRLDKRTEALATIEQAIDRTTDDEALSELFQSLAGFYEEYREPELSALALDKAVEYQPGDTNLKFRAAVAYAECGLNDLSLLHYKLILQVDPDNASVQNNLAVQYQNLKMPTLAVKAYCKAYDQGNTLSAANLAYLFLQAGFAEESENLLNEARQQPDPHPNVDQAIGAVTKQVESDRETESATLRAARERRSFLSDYANAYFVTANGNAPWVGEWLSTDGKCIAITEGEQADSLRGEWSEGKTNYLFKGSTQGRAARLGQITGKRVDETWAMPVTVARHGYAHMTHDHETIKIMGITDTNTRYFELRRVSKGNHD